MGKMNWGTTAEVLGGVGTKVAQKLGEKKAAKKQATSYDSSGSASDSGSGTDSSAGIGGGAESGSFKRGGVVKKTGLAKVHKGERVLSKKQRRKYDGRKR